MKFGEQAFQKERSYGDSQNDGTAKEELTKIRNSNAEEILKKDAMQDICDFEEVLGKSWLKNRGVRFKQEDQKFVSFVFAGSSTGVFKIFPGWLVPDGFDPTLRPWFRKAAQSDKMVLVVYKDSFSESNRLSVAKVGLKIF